MASQAKVIIKGQNNIGSAVKSAASDLNSIPSIPRARCFSLSCHPLHRKNPDPFPKTSCGECTVAMKKESTRSAIVPSLAMTRERTVARVNEEQAKTVRYIFRRFRRKDSVCHLKGADGAQEENRNR